MKSARGFAPLVLLIIGLIVGAGAVIAYNHFTTYSPLKIDDEVGYKRISSTPTPQSAERQTYTNSKYKYQFTYPEDWIVEMGGIGMPGDDSKIETMSQIKITSKSIPEYEFTVWIFAASGASGPMSTYLDDIENNPKNSLEPLIIYSRENTTLGDSKAIKYVTNAFGGNVLNLGTIRNGTLYRLTVEHFEEEPRNVERFNQLLNNFKFVD